MKKLFEKSYVIYDKANDHVIQFSDGKFMLFGNKEEADANCYGNEVVIPHNKLPEHWKEVILKQINEVN